MAIRTTVEIKALKPKPDRYDVSVACEDGEGNQVGGGQIRVYPNGRKVFRDRNNGDPITVGPFPAISLAAFQDQLREHAKLRAHRKDPKDHLQQQQVAAAKAKAEAQAAITVEQLAKEFIAEYVRKRHRDPLQTERLLNVEILGDEAKPTWRYRKVRDLKLRDAVLLVRAIDKRAPSVANDTVSLIKKLWRFGAGAGHDVDAKEMADLQKLSIEESRERALDVDEIRTFWLGMDDRSSSQPGGTLKKGRDDRRGTREEPRLSRALALGLKLLLVLAQRRSELLQARWREFDLANKVWTIPAAHLKTTRKDSKNLKPHKVPLSELAIELLEEVKALSDDSEYLFPTAHTQRVGDAPMDEKSLTRAAARNQCGLEHWTPHDLRRTAATHMNRLGINFIWVEKVLNHKLQGMLKVYNQHPYEDEKRQALDQWAAELRRIIAGKSNVVALPNQRARA